MAIAEHDPMLPRLEAEPIQVALPLVDILKVMTLVAEILLVTYALIGHGWLTLVFGHVGLLCVLALALILIEYSGLESGDLQKFILSTTTGGPIGAAAALVGGQQRGSRQSQALEEWYNTIAPPEQAAVTLVDQIIDGRLIREAARLPQRYDGLLATGSMQEKQALLAYLAAEEDQVLASEALKLALRSSDQRVRVQAAAVAAHARTRARHMLPPPVSARVNPPEPLHP